MIQTSFDYHIGKNLAPSAKFPLYCKVTVEHLSEEAFIIKQIAFRGTEVMYVTSTVDLITEVRECVEEMLKERYNPQPEESLVEILYKVAKPKEAV